MAEHSPGSDGALFEVTRRTGRHSRLLEEAIADGEQQGRLQAIDRGLLSLARANAQALDDAEADRKYYAIAQLTAPYREVLQALRMTPIDRIDEADDELNRALAELSAPEVRDPSA